MKTKVIDTREYVSVLKELTEEGKEVSLVVAGRSMSPFLVHERDVIRFTKPNRKLRKGDMVFYQREDGQYVMHRICKIRAAGYYMIGDAQREAEGPIPEERIFALVTGVQRKGKWIGSEDFWWKFFAHVWVRVIPFRSVFEEIYAWAKNVVVKEHKEI